MDNLSFNLLHNFHIGSDSIHFCPHHRSHFPIEINDENLIGSSYRFGSEGRIFESFSKSHGEDPWWSPTLELE